MLESLQSEGAYAIIVSNSAEIALFGPSPSSSSSCACLTRVLGSTLARLSLCPTACSPCSRRVHGLLRVRPPPLDRLQEAPPRGLEHGRCGVRHVHGLHGGKCFSTASIRVCRAPPTRAHAAPCSMSPSLRPTGTPLSLYVPPTPSNKLYLLIPRPMCAFVL